MAEAAGRYPRLTIGFRRGDTADRWCAEYADRWYGTFTTPAVDAVTDAGTSVGAYQDGCSILVLPPTYDDYWNEAAGYYTRRKVRRALKLGYRCEVVQREDFSDDIHAVNTSLAERQGRPMDESYTARDPSLVDAFPAYPCRFHQVRTYGVLRGDRLVAYANIYQLGELSHIATILGHGDHLDAGIMYLLIAEATRDLMTVAATKYVMYNMHDSGTRGLRFFKEQMGFRPYRVNWRLADEPVRGWTAGDAVILGKAVLRRARELSKLVRAS